ncbi:MAG TPA: PTS sugar transporter subunit IIB [Myxococcaceae bacterium]|nr:PTS sugar transporter subunit IIB [Myxococcaceae bacterium]
MISLVRVDNRLIHGQVIEAWLPHLRVEHLVVADDEACENALMREAMKMAVPSTIEVTIRPLAEVDYRALVGDKKKTLLLMRDVSNVVEAREKGLPVQHVNLGNVHFSAGRKQVSASVFLSPTELVQLKMLAEQGAEVEARGVPTDRPVPLPEIEERFGRG